VRVLFDLCHPAHFHLFKHAITALRRAGHQVEIVAHQKDCLPALLDGAGWSYRLVRRRRKGIVLLACEALRTLGLISAMGMRRRFDLMVGTSIAIGPAARLTGATSVVFCEDDARVVPLFARPAYLTAHYVVTPRALAYENHGRKHFTYPGYHELAYLHPNRFRPDRGVLDVLGVRPGERYFLLRLVAFRAHHDVGQKGLTLDQARQLVDRLKPHGRVFISAEEDLPEDLRPLLLPTRVDQVLDVVAQADLLAGDSQSMTMEAANLGTPSLRCNTLVGRLSVMQELEHRYGLTAGFRPEQWDCALGRIDQWLAMDNLKAEWQSRRRAMLADCVDLTDWMLDLFTRLAQRGRPSPMP